MYGITDKAKYLSFAFLAKYLYEFKLIDKNHALFRKKRRYLLKVIPDAKLSAEVAVVAHTLFHPYRNEKSIQSTNEHLGSLLDECGLRKIDSETIKWARKVLDSEYVPRPKENAGSWAPEIGNLEAAERIFKSRKSNRYCADKSFDKDLIYRLIRSSIEAPSSCNKQSWRFIIYDEPDMIKKIAEIKNQQFLEKFPFVVCVCFDRDTYMGLDQEMTPYLDCGAAIQNLCNAACAANLAVCWCNFTIANAGKRRHDAFRRAAGIPPNLMPVSFVALGIPAAGMEKPPREDLMFYLPKEGKR